MRNSDATVQPSSGRTLSHESVPTSAHSRSSLRTVSRILSNCAPSPARPFMHSVTVTADACASMTRRAAYSGAVKLVKESR